MRKKLEGSNSGKFLGSSPPKLKLCVRPWTDYIKYQIIKNNCLDAYEFKKGGGRRRKKFILDMWEM